MKNTRSRRWLLAAVAAAALLATGCGVGEDPALDPQTTAGASDSGLNDADVTFLQGMIPHHEQATEMAELVEDRTERDELRTFADKVIADQSAEIQQMQSLLEAGGEEEAAGHGGMGGMSGQMDESEMAELEAMEGPEFDLMFIDMMTRHHESAIEMAEQVIDDGENPDVKQLANGIIEAQQAEIEQMASWREDWSG